MTSVSVVDKEGHVRFAGASNVNTRPTAEDDVDAFDVEELFDEVLVSDRATEDCVAMRFAVNEVESSQRSSVQR